MNYSIFAGTMADLNYEQIEEAAKLNAVVLLPVAVIEEHGPHMCLGVDTYLTYELCRKVSGQLRDKGYETLLAPPIYWGINHANSAFAGSFTVRENTMVALLVDFMVCLKEWGFKKIFIVNVHGDYQHNKAILKAAREARQEYQISVRALLPVSMYSLHKLLASDDHVLPFDMPDFQDIDGYIDLHAGAVETGWMYNNFPALVDIDLARTLKSSKTTFREMIIWGKGGLDAKNITPGGYVGDPSQFDRKKARVFERQIVENISHAILTYLSGDRALLT